MNREDESACTLIASKREGWPAVFNDNPATGAPLAEIKTADTLLPVELLQRGRYQPRCDIDPATLTELTDSIRSQGIVQPIVVRPIEAGRFEIVAGERRWRAAKLAGLALVPVVIRELDDLAVMVFARAENTQREQLNPMEEAVALRMLAEHMTGVTGTVPAQRMLADMVGKSASWVSKRLAILERPESVQQALVAGTISVDEAARRPGSSGEVKPPSCCPTARVDMNILQSSVERLDTLADTLGLPGIELPGKPTRKDYATAFEQRIMEILDAATRAIKPE